MASTLMAELKWAESYEMGFKTAQSSHKNVMVMLSKEDCPACWYMENVVFENDGLVDELENDFVVIHLDIHKDDTQGLNYIGTPTIYFISTTKKQLGRIDGAANIKEFTKAMREARKVIK